MSACVYLSITAVFLQSTSISEAYDTQICTMQKQEYAQIRATDSESSFYRFLEQHISWVDRSLLIKTIWREKKKIIFISTPRRWGRDVNLAMLKAFFAIKKDAGELANNYFANGVLHDTKNNLIKVHPVPMISNHQDVIKEALGKFPVIYVNFVGVYSEGSKSLLNPLSRAFSDHRLVLYSVKGDKNASLHLKNLAKECLKITHAWSEKGITTYALLTGVQNLSEFLHVYYGKKVVLLINEYDAILRESYFSYYGHEDAKQKQQNAEDLYKKFTQCTFYLNKHLEKAIVTSVLPVAAALGFNSTDDVREYKIIDGDDIYKFYGFSTVDVFDMMKLRGFPNSLNAGVIKWYGGFHCPNSPSGSIFSPYSVVMFMLYDKRKLCNQMTKSQSVSSTFRLKRYPLFRDALLLFLVDKTYDIDYSKIKRLDIEHCRLMYDFTTNKTLKDDEFKREHCDIALTFLCSMGYLTADKTFANNGKNGTHIRVKVPNRETFEEMASHFPSSRELRSIQLGVAID